MSHIGSLSVLGTVSFLQHVCVRVDLAHKVRSSLARFTVVDLERKGGPNARGSQKNGFLATLQPCPYRYMGVYIFTSPR